MLLFGSPSFYEPQHDASVPLKRLAWQPARLIKRPCRTALPAPGAFRTPQRLWHLWLEPGIRAGGPRAGKAAVGSGQEGLNLVVAGTLFCPHFCFLWFSGKSNHLTAKVLIFAPLPTSTKLNVSSFKVSDDDGCFCLRYKRGWTVAIFQMTYVGFGTHFFPKESCALTFLGFPWSGLCEPTSPQLRPNFAPTSPHLQRQFDLGTNFQTKRQGILKIASFQSWMLTGLWQVLLQAHLAHFHDPAEVKPTLFKQPAVCFP